MPGPRSGTRAVTPCPGGRAAAQPLLAAPSEQHRNTSCNSSVRAGCRAWPPSRSQLHICLPHGLSLQVTTQMLLSGGQSQEKALGGTHALLAHVP